MAFAINAKTTFFCTKTAAQHFIAQGRGGIIVNIAAASVIATSQAMEVTGRARPLSSTLRGRQRLNSLRTTFV